MFLRRQTPDPLFPPTQLTWRLWNSNVWLSSSVFIFSVRVWCHRSVTADSPPSDWLQEWNMAAVIRVHAVLMSLNNLCKIIPAFLNGLAALSTVAVLQLLLSPTRGAVWNWAPPPLRHRLQALAFFLSPDRCESPENMFSCRNEAKKCYFSQIYIIFLQVQRHKNTFLDENYQRRWDFKGPVFPPKTVRTENILLV